MLTRFIFLFGVTIENEYNGVICGPSQAVQAPSFLPMGDVNIEHPPAMHSAVGTNNGK